MEINIDGQIVNVSHFILLWNELVDRIISFPAPFFKSKMLPYSEQLNWSKLIEKFRVMILYFPSVRTEIEFYCLLSQKYKIKD